MPLASARVSVSFDVAVRTDPVGAAAPVGPAGPVGPVGPAGPVGPVAPDPPPPFVCESIAIFEPINLKLRDYTIIADSVLFYISENKSFTLIKKRVYYIHGLGLSQIETRRMK